MKKSSKPSNPGACLLNCSPLLSTWLRQKLDDSCTFIESPDFWPWLSYVVLADRTTTTHEEWEEFVKVRSMCAPVVNWLIIFDDVPYENTHDTKVVRVKTPKDILTSLLKLRYKQP